MSIKQGLEMMFSAANMTNFLQLSIVSTNVLMSQAAHNYQVTFHWDMLYKSTKQLLVPIV